MARAELGIYAELRRNVKDSAPNSLYDYIQQTRITKLLDYCI